MNKFRDIEDTKMTQTELLKIENGSSQKKNILDRIKNRLDTANASITWRHRNKNYPEWNPGLKRQHQLAIRLLKEPNIYVMMSKS